MKESEPISPPRWAQRFLRWYCRPELAEDLEGDLNEHFERNLQHRGKRLARIIYIIPVGPDIAVGPDIRPDPFEAGSLLEGGSRSFHILRTVFTHAIVHLVTILYGGEISANKAKLTFTHVPSPDPWSRFASARFLRSRLGEKSRLTSALSSLGVMDIDRNRCSFRPDGGYLRLAGGLVLLFMVSPEVNEIVGVWAGGEEVRKNSEIPSVNKLSSIGEYFRGFYSFPTPSLKVNPDFVQSFLRAIVLPKGMAPVLGAFASPQTDNQLVQVEASFVTKEVRVGPKKNAPREPRGGLIGCAGMSGEVCFFLDLFWFFGASPALSRGIQPKKNKQSMIR